MVVNIFHLSKLWEEKFFVLCDVIFLARLQRKFEIDHSDTVQQTPTGLGTAWKTPTCASGWSLISNTESRWTGRTNWSSRSVVAYRDRVGRHASSSFTPKSDQFQTSLRVRSGDRYSRQCDQTGSTGDQSKALAKRRSQLKPNRAKLQNQNLHWRLAKLYRQVEQACKKPFKLSEYEWELAWVGWGAQTKENVARVGRKFELDQIQANSSQLKQVGGQTIPNSIKVVNLARVGLSWEDRLART